jgi:aromatic-L-amino-acid decarboxylase
MHPLEPSAREIADMMAVATDYVTGFVDSLAGPQVPAESPPRELLLAPPPARPGDFGELVGLYRRAAATATDTAGPGCFAYFPGGGVVSSAVAEVLSRTANRYSGSGSMATDLVAMEHGVLRWLCERFGLPARTSGGVLTTGTSTGLLAAIVTAREELLGEDFTSGTLYLTAQTHHSVAKAARIAGLPARAVRVVPTTARRRMDAAALAAMVAADRAAGLRPFLVVGTAGTTNTGAVDPLDELADLAAAEDLWFHVDAAYGGGFWLTERGKARMRGMERADSITFDAHKSLFLPYTTGVLLVADARPLLRAHTADADYLQDLDLEASLPNFADMGAELSREYRGLRLWLPLHLHGTDAFVSALDEKLDLSAVLHRELVALGLWAPEPDLTVHVFRAPGGEEVNRALLAEVNASGRTTITSTQIDGEFTLRLCVINHRTHREHVDEAVAAIRRALSAVGRAAA